MPNLGAKIQKSVNLAYSQKLDKTDQIFLLNYLIILVLLFGSLMKKCCMLEQQ